MYNPDEPPSASQASQTTFEPSAAAFPFASTNTTAIPDSFRYRASSSGYRTPSSSISSVSRPTAGRKRSADEISIDETPRFPDAAGIAAVRRARGENVDGVGIDVDVDVAGQTGSWAEELAERMRRSYVTEENSGTVLVPRKSQRMNGDASGMDHGAPALRRQSVEVSPSSRGLVLLCCAMGLKELRNACLTMPAGTDHRHCHQDTGNRLDLVDRGRQYARRGAGLGALH